MESLILDSRVYIYNYSFIFTSVDQILNGIIFIEKFNFTYKNIEFLYILNIEIPFEIGLTLKPINELWKILTESYPDLNETDKENILKLINKNLNPFGISKIPTMDENKDIKYYLNNINIPNQIKTEIEFEEKIKNSKFNDDVFHFHDSNYLIIIYQSYIYLRMNQKYDKKDLNTKIAPYKISDLNYFDLPYILYRNRDNIMRDYTIILDELIFYLFKFNQLEPKPYIKDLFKNKKYDTLFMNLNLLYLSLLK
jgi:hypothetical protein